MLDREEPDHRAAVVRGDVARLAAHRLGARLDAGLETEEVRQARDDRVARRSVVDFEGTYHRRSRRAETRRLTAT